MNKINDIIKNHWGKIVALLTNYLQDIELAEDVMQDALESAIIHWNKNGIPENPQAWLFITAKHKALDKIRRAHNFLKKQEQYKQLLDINSQQHINEQDYTIPDERLRLIFTCCHPALDSSISVALTLRLLGGLTTKEIAKAYLVKPETLAQRLVRGKNKIKQKAIPYNIPERNEFAERLERVLTVLYLIFNEGYSASSGDIPIRHSLCKEAIRLTKILLRLCPKEAEVKGLFALMLLHDSRKLARYSQSGEFIPLEFHDRSLWNSTKIKRGINLVKSALLQKQIGSYQLQATISAIHAEAKSYNTTNWQEIVLVYDELLKINSSNVIKLNRLVAVSCISPVSKVIKDLNKLEIPLKNYQSFYAVKADFLVKLGKTEQAKYYYKMAIKLNDNLQVNKFLKSRLSNL